MTNEIINVCFIEKNFRILVDYSHLIPIIISIMLALFVFIKAKYNLFSKIFLFFIITFSIWLIGDLITWNSNNYNLIYTFWATLDFIEVTFYILGLYFVLVFTEQKDISVLKKIILFLLLAPAFFIAVTNQSVVGFNYQVCEALNNNFLSIYKLIVEGILLFIMLLSIITPFIKKLPWQKKKTRLIMVGSMFLFLAIFSGTEYISSITGVYEYTLYSLFLLPALLLIIIYSVFELDIFHFHMLGTQYLVVGLVILMGGQLFFVNGTTDQLLTILTTVITIGLSIILFRNLKRESDQRIHIEQLSEIIKQSKKQVEETNKQLGKANEKLKSLDQLKTEFLSLASHQLRSPLTAIKGYTSMLLEGDYGEIDPKAKATIERVFESTNNLTIVVEDLLNVAKIEQGGMKYEMAKFNLSEIARDMAKDLSITAEKKGLKLNYEEVGAEDCVTVGDKEKLRQVVLNFIDNSIKYTKEGEIKVKVERKEDKVIFSVKDTGMGMTEETKETLFQKFARGEGGRVNSGGSGLGLYLAKEIAEAHKGKVWVESEGPGKGSTFYMELDADCCKVE
ncbi:MAG: ATP-binding protein [Candidatus Paceibacterota bacterium]